MLPSQLGDLATAIWAGKLLAADNGVKQGIDRLDGATRAKVFAALAALIILGFGLVILAWMGARYTRRYMGASPLKPTGLQRTDDWVRPPAQDQPVPDKRAQPPPPD